MERDKQSKAQTIIQSRNKLLVVAGPTAVGKTALAVELAAALDGEVISGDSMQFYRGFDIGTAKIRPQEMKAANGQIIPHHLIDIINPDEPYTVADFQRAAGDLVQSINAKGRLPILAGGTGLYVSALIHGYTFDKQAGVDWEFRRQKEAFAAEHGTLALYNELLTLDPVAAKRISANDLKRIIRALEVQQLTGRTLSSQSKRRPPDWDVFLLGLTRERAELYQRINQRVLLMLEAGLIQEVQGLLRAGCGRELKPMQGLGYKQICSYLAGELSLEAATEEIQRATRHFAKRQLTWFRHEPLISWFSLGEDRNEKEVLAEILHAVREGLSL